MDIVIKNVDVLSLPICVFNSKERFDYLLYNIEKYKKLFKNKEEILVDAVKNDYINVIKYFNNIDVNFVLRYACFYNKIDIIDYIIKKELNIGI